MSQDYIPLATVTLASSASSVTFSNIPATYRDLVVVFSVIRATGANTFIRVNGDTGSNYSQVRMFGDGSSTGSDSASASTIDLGTSATGYNSVTQLMDYSATDKHKTLLIRQNLASAYTLALAGRWANTAAINTVQLYTTAAAFETGTTASLYGIVS